MTSSKAVRKREKDLEDRLLAIVATNDTSAVLAALDTLKSFTQEKRDHMNALTERRVQLEKSVKNLEERIAAAERRTLAAGRAQQRSASRASVCDELYTSVHRRRQMYEERIEAVQAQLASLCAGDAAPSATADTVLDDVPQDKGESLRAAAVREANLLQRRRAVLHTLRCRYNALRTENDCCAEQVRILEKGGADADALFEGLVELDTMKSTSA